MTVNTVAPGFIETDMTKALNDEQRATTLTNVPAGRLGDPREIASASAHRQKQRILQAKLCM